MDNPAGAIRYAIRQFRLSPVFTASAVLTLSLGIGGTTAIFTLIHAVMLRSLPVADPERLYRVGDGDNCCVQGGPQDRWGMFSYPLFERLKTEAPEFEQLTAFQAGGYRVSVRRPGVDVAARSLRTEYVTGNYFTTFGIGAFGGRVFTADDDTPASPPVVVISHHSWEAIYGGDQSLVGQTLVIEGHPFTVAGVAPPGFFGDTLRNNPPDLWIPIQHEPLVTGANSLLRQPVSAWLRVIGRLKPGATTDGIAPRLTNVLRQWIPRDSGWPANWLSDVDHLLPKQTIAIVPAGAGVGVMKEQYASSLQLLMAVCGLVLLIACANVADLLLARAVGRRTQTAGRMAIVGRSFLVRAHRAACPPGDAVRRPRRRRDDARPQLEQRPASGLRVHRARSRPRRDQPAVRGLHRAAADGDVPQARRSAEPHPGRAVSEPRALQPADRQLGRADSRRRPSAAEARRQRGRVVGSRERALPAAPRHDDGARAHVHGGGQRNDRAGRDRQRSVRQALLQERRGSDRPALRPRRAAERRHVHDRRRRPRREVAELPVPAAAAADVLRAARAEGELREQRDDARRDPAALHQRADARHKAGAGRARAARDEGDGGRRSEPDVHERADARAAGRPDVLPGPRGREPRGALRRRVAPARGDRPVRRYRLLGRPADKRDRDPDGARRGQGRGVESRPAQRVHARGDGIGTRRAAGHRRRQIARRAVVRCEVLGSGRPGCGCWIP